MIFCKELNKSFKSKDEMFKEIKKNLPEIIRLKKEQIFESRNKGISVALHKLDATKIKGVTGKLAFEVDDEHYYIAVNTCLILDSHDDLHAPGLWNDSVVSEQGKNYLVSDHSLAMANVIVKKAYIEQFIATIPFAAIGKSYTGDTQALIYKFRKDAVINQVAKDWLESGDDIEASVRMRYEDLEFALDSNDPDDREMKALYDEWLPKIANKDDFEYIYYFFLVTKATNVRESSLVIAGSNSATGPITVSAETKEENIDPLQSSQKLKSSLLLI